MSCTRLQGSRIDKLPSLTSFCFSVCRGVVVLPKSVTPARIEKNYKLVKLDEEDMKVLNGLQKTKAKRFIKPEWGPKVDLEFKDW